ncbi:MAG: hypothetical protein HQL53_10860 [Magnetococcales bacterium]|nr:hypothetical protein [Magnetococcales bacterium]
MNGKYWMAALLALGLTMSGCNEEDAKGKLDSVVDQGLGKMEEGRKALEDSTSKADGFLKETLDKSMAMADEAGKSMDEKKSFFDEMLAKFEKIFGG